MLPSNEAPQQSVHGKHNVYNGLHGEHNEHGSHGHGSNGHEPFFVTLEFDAFRECWILVSSTWTGEDLVAFFKFTGFNDRLNILIWYFCCYYCKLVLLFCF